MGEESLAFARTNSSFIFFLYELFGVGAMGYTFLHKKFG